MTIQSSTSVQRVWNYCNDLRDDDLASVTRMVPRRSWGCCAPLSKTV